MHTRKLLDRLDAKTRTIAKLRRKLARTKKRIRPMLSWGPKTDDVDGAAATILMTPEEAQKKLDELYAATH